MTKTTNEQWEYLFEIIQKSETKSLVSTKKS